MAAEPINCDDFVIATENPDMCPQATFCTDWTNATINGIPVGVCVEESAPDRPTLPTTGPAPYGQTLGLTGVLMIAVGVTAVRLARH